eukprot:SAG25_NODE_924_length_4745_cov_2.602238_6_plen_107_part_00
MPAASPSCAAPTPLSRLSRSVSKTAAPTQLTHTLACSTDKSTPRDLGRAARAHTVIVLPRLVDGRRGGGEGSFKVGRSQTMDGGKLASLAVQLKPSTSVVVRYAKL